MQVKYATPAASSYGMISLGLLLVTGLRPVRERSCRHRPGTATGNGNPAQNYLLCATSLLTTEPIPVAQNGGSSRFCHRRTGPLCDRGVRWVWADSWLGVE